MEKHRALQLSVRKNLIPWPIALVTHLRRNPTVLLVGILLATLYVPVWISTIGSGHDFGLAVLSFAALSFWRVPPWLVVVAGGSGWLVARLIPGPVSCRYCWFAPMDCKSVPSNAGSFAANAGSMGPPVAIIPGRKNR
jgi:hypothetical protein